MVYGAVYGTIYGDFWFVFGVCGVRVMATRLLRIYRHSEDVFRLISELPIFLVPRRNSTATTLTHTEHPRAPHHTATTSTKKFRPPCVCAFFCPRSPLNMPKYSTVQAYSDNSSNVQTVSYEQASGTAAAKGGGAGESRRRCCRSSRMHEATLLFSQSPPSQ